MFLIRMFRGEFPLWKSFWLCGVLGFSVFRTLLSGLNYMRTAFPEFALLSSAATLAVYVLMVDYFYLQCRGLLRSASSFEGNTLLKWSAVAVELFVVAMIAISQAGMLMFYAKNGMIMTSLGIAVVYVVTAGILGRTLS